MECPVGLVRVGRSPTLAASPYTPSFPRAGEDSQKPRVFGHFRAAPFTPARGHEVPLSPLSTEDRGLFAGVGVELSASTDRHGPLVLELSLLVSDDGIGLLDLVSTS